jgi:hypothetical protein
VPALTAVALLFGCGDPGEERREIAPAPATSTEPATSRPTEIAAGEWQDRRRAAALEVLRARSRAILGADATAYLASSRHGRERERDLERFERMVAIGLSELTVVALEETTPPVPVAPAATATWDVEATFDYRIKGFDRAPRRFVLDLTLTASPSRPEGLVITGSRPADRPQPWDVEGMQVRRSRASLVLGSAAGADLDEVLERADRAAREVSAVWGTAVPTVWVVPSGTDEAERLLGRSPGGLEGVAAATDGPLEPGQVAGADRIVLSPTAWSSLEPIGREVVMTHELTHVAVRASTTRPVPLWLSEGFAEFVAYRSVDLPDRTIASPLVTRLRDEGLPRHLPGPDRFDPGAGAIASAYGEAWIAVSSLVQAHGQAKVVAFYRAVAGDAAAGSADDAEAVVDEALVRVLGTTRVELEQAWLARLRLLLR